MRVPDVRGRRAVASPRSAESHEFERARRPARESRPTPALGERAEVDAGEAEPIDQGGHGGVGPGIVASEKQHAPATAFDGIGRAQRRTQVIESLDDPCVRDQAGECLAGRAAVEGDGLEQGASTGLLASMTMRPPNGGRPASASGSLDPCTATKTIGWAAVSVRGTRHGCRGPGDCTRAGARAADRSPHAGQDESEGPRGTFYRGCWKRRRGVQRAARATSLSSRWAAGADEAGFWPVISRPSTIT